MELVRTRTQKRGGHWGGHQKDEGRDGDQRLLGEGLLREKETRQDGRVGM